MNQRALVNFSQTLKLENIPDTFVVEGFSRKVYFGLAELISEFFVFREEKRWKDKF
jgi:hypothetical protein